MKVPIAVVQTTLDRSERCHEINMERASRQFKLRRQGLFLRPCLS